MNSRDIKLKPDERVVRNFKYINKQLSATVLKFPHKIHVKQSVVFRVE